MGFEEDGIVKNPNAPKVTFTKRRGQLRLLADGKDIAGEKLVLQRISEMRDQVEHAERGSTVTTMKDVGPGSAEFKRHGIKSTFPSFFTSLGFKSKEDFVKVLNRKEGVRYNRLVDQAVEDLLKGYESPFGDVPPSQEFKIKSRQIFDNRNVTFRTIDGKVVPIRSKKQPKFEDLEEAPF